MCFNISLLSPLNWELLAGGDLPGYDIPPGPIYRSNAFSNPLHPIRCMDRKDAHILSRWGLVPGWVKDGEQARAVRRSCYNARGETMFSKPAFRTAAKGARCLVPVTGFFEFREVAGKRYPYHVRMMDGRTFGLGGLYQDTTLLSGHPERTFSIVTTDANELLGFVHNTKFRMPLILPRGKEDAWLDDGASPEKVQGLIAPYQGNDLEAYPVTRDLLKGSGMTDPSKALERVHYAELDQTRLDNIGP